ncbi:MAG TPA: DEAD/DEAH box helicase, partial [Kaistella sp.]|nr:DEAD/DEAH box helicase [Kaistella sp.]
MNLFTETNLSPDLLKAIGELGFTSPTEIQKQTIPFISSDIRDLIALAQTGTGKTAAFSL